MEHCKTNPDAIHLIPVAQSRRKLWFMASLATHQVRHVVRDHLDGRYLNAAGEWTASADQAFNFPNAISAVQLCLRHGWSRSELVIVFDDGSVSKRALFA